MEYYINQVNNHIDNLVKIAITERKQNGIGVSFLDFTEADRMDCRYVAIADPIFPDIVRQRYLDRINSVPNSVIFFLIYDGIDELLYEVDLDKNSTFYEKQGVKKTSNE